MTAGSGAGHGGLDALGAYRFHRLLTVPRRPEDPRTEDRTAAQLTAAVTAAHAVLGRHGDGRQAGLAAAWVRPGPHRPMHFLVGGAPSSRPPGTGPATRPSTR